MTGTMVHTTREEVTSVWFKQVPDVVRQDILIWHRKLFAFNSFRLVRHGCNYLRSVENFANAASHRARCLFCLNLLIPLEDDGRHYAHFACLFLHRSVVR